MTSSSLPAPMLAKLMATIWDQNAGLHVMSPIAAMLEEISSNWLIDLLGLSKETAVGFVPGATMARMAGKNGHAHQREFMGNDGSGYRCFTGGHNPDCKRSHGSDKEKIDKS